MEETSNPITTGYMQTDEPAGPPPEVVFLPQEPRAFPGTIPANIFTDVPEEKWVRGHEKRRLRAYLKGHTMFQHGWIQPGIPMMWPTYPKKQESPTQEQK